MKKNARLLYLLTVWTLFAPYVAPANTTPPDDDILPAPSPTVTYVLSMPEPQTHYFEVEMQVKNSAALTNARKNRDRPAGAGSYVDIKMPVWTPGSYLIREYAKNVEGFTATASGKPVVSEKIR